MMWTLTRTPLDVSNVVSIKLRVFNGWYLPLASCSITHESADWGSPVVANSSNSL